MRTHGISDSGNLVPGAGWLGLLEQMTDKALPELAPQSPKPQGLNSTHGMGTSLHIYMHARESHDLFKALVLVLPLDSASTDVLRSGVFHLVFANFCNVDVDAGACSKNNSDDHIVCSTAETACDQASQFLDLL